MRKLSEEVKACIVRAFACYRTPQEASDIVYEEFGIRVDRSHCRIYHPEKEHNGRWEEVAQKWRVLFDETRKGFKARTFERGIALAEIRAQELDDLYRRAKKRQLKLALEMLKTADEWFGRQGPEVPADSEAGEELAMPDDPEAAIEWLERQIADGRMARRKTPAPFGRRS